MSLRRVLLVCVAASVLPLSISAAHGEAPPSPWCATGDPKSVLACLETAYDTRDIAAYEKLLAEDFRFAFAGGGMSWGRKEDVEGTRKSVFENPDISSVDLGFEGEPQVTVGNSPDTWTLQGMKLSIKITLTDKSMPDLVVAGTDGKFTVRLIQSPEPHYVIVEWIDLGKSEQQD